MWLNLSWYQFKLQIYIFRKLYVISIVTKDKIGISEVLVAQSGMTLWNLMDSPGSSVHEILQARILASVAIPFSRGSCQLRDWTWVTCLAGRFFTVWATREAPNSYRTYTKETEEGVKQVTTRSAKYKRRQQWRKWGTKSCKTYGKQIKWQAYIFISNYFKCK